MQKIIDQSKQEKTTTRPEFYRQNLIFQRDIKVNSATETDDLVDMASEL
jgi:hypothetical protein